MAEVTQNSILRISDDKTLELIELYEREECLWNTTLDTYKVREKRTRAAARIARTLSVRNFEAKHVMIKFKNLRNSYCQELKKIALSASMGLGEEETYRPKVFWFNKMDSFLRPHLQPSRTMLREGTSYSFSHEDMGTAPDESKEEVEIKQEPSEASEEPEEWVQMSNPEDVMLAETASRRPSENDDSPPPKSIKRKSSSRHPPKRPKQEAVFDENSSTQLLQSISTNLEALRRCDDPFDSFGKYVASLLRTMPMQRAMNIQPKIVSIIMAVITGSSEGRVSQSDENI